MRATLANHLLCLPLPSFAGLISLPGRVLRVGPVGQGLHGGPDSLGWERDRHWTSENPPTPVRTPCPTLWHHPLRNLVAETPAGGGGNKSYSTLCSQGLLWAPGSVRACAVCVHVRSCQGWEMWWKHRPWALPSKGSESEPGNANPLGVPEVSVCHQGQGDLGLSHLPLPPIPTHSPASYSPPPSSSSYLGSCRGAAG